MLCADRILRRKASTTLRRAATAARCGVEPLEGRRLLSAGDLDPTFDGDGRATTDIGGGSSASDVAHAVVAVQADGKIVVVGEHGAAGARDFAVVRYNADGSLDTSFDGDGKATIDFGGDDSGYSIALDSSGRIVVAGYSNQGGTGAARQNDFAVSRINTNGSLDTTFDGDGKVTISFGSIDDLGYSVAIDASGRIVVGGESFRSGTGYDFSVARLSGLDGSLDTSFDGDGKATVDFGGIDRAFSVTTDADGDVVVGGVSFVSGSGTDYDWALARLRAIDGALDASLDGDGKLTVDFGSTYDEGEAVAIDGDGRIVFAGYSKQDGSAGGNFAIARLNDNGTFDSSFDGDGKASIDSGSTYDSARSFALDNDGHIVIGGVTARGGTGFDFAVLRLNAADGSLDPSFGGDGIVTVDFGASDDYGFSVALDAEDRIVIGGYSSQGGTTGNDFAVARLFGAAPNSAPVAAADSYTVSEGGAIAADDEDGSATAGADDNGVLANDTDGDGDTLTATLVSGPSHGVLTFNSDGTFTYIHNGSDTTSDSFVYEVNDGRGGTDQATAGITITPPITGVTTQPDPCDSTKTALVVRGSENGDQLHVGPGDSAGTFKVVVNGVSSIHAVPTGHIIVYGEGGDDNIQVAGSISTSAWLYGEAGDDRIKGGDGDDVILGGAGADMPVGGSGRDLMIGGDGSDRIVGNADDDILIAGFTQHDANQEALCEIMEEWTRTGTSYEDRLEHLRGSSPGGQNDSIFLSGTTVFDDADADILTGGAGLDWFMFDGLSDRITDLHSGEFTVEDLAFIGP